MPAIDDEPTAKGQRPDAFASYRRLPADTAFVDRLQEALSARGKQLWVDRTDIVAFSPDGRILATAGGGIPGEASLALAGRE